MEGLAGEAHQGETGKAIDFLYCDIRHINSLYAQLFQGNLIAVTLEESSRRATETAVSAGVTVLEGARRTERENLRTLREQIEPHHSKILSILDALNLPILHRSLNAAETGEVVLLKGSVSIRDYQTFKSLFPRILDINGSEQLFGQEIKLDWLAKKQSRKAFFALLDMLPAGLELEVVTEQGENAAGPIHSEYLTESPENLLRTYGTRLPGTWFVLGIVRKLELSKGARPKREFAAFFDDLSSALSGIYSAGLRYAIAPMLVFQELRWTSASGEEPRP